MTIVRQHWSLIATWRFIFQPIVLQGQTSFLIDFLYQLEMIFFFKLSQIFVSSSIWVFSLRNPSLQSIDCERMCTEHAIYSLDTVATSLQYSKRYLPITDRVVVLRLRDNSCCCCCCHIPSSFIHFVSKNDIDIANYNNVHQPILVIFGRGCWVSMLLNGGMLFHLT